MWSFNSSCLAIYINILLLLHCFESWNFPIFNVLKFIYSKILKNLNEAHCEVTPEELGMFELGDTFVCLVCDVAREQWFWVMSVLGDLLLWHACESHAMTFPSLLKALLRENVCILKVPFQACGKNSFRKFLDKFWYNDPVNIFKTFLLVSLINLLSFAPQCNKSLWFVKVHGPWDVLLTYAEMMKMKMPLRVSESERHC